jgi:hypothetical protein
MAQTVERSQRPVCEIAAHCRAQCCARPGVLCSLRLCALPNIDAVERAQDQLLSLSGSDAWRRLGGPICRSRPIRQDRLDAVVWTEILKLLEDPSLIQNELDRRMEATRHADPTRRREAPLQRDLCRLQKSIERLLTAYQEDLLLLDELRHIACPICAGANTQSVPSCNRLQTRRPTALLICVSPKR